MNNVFIIIIGMMVVTYIPRLVPFYLVSDKKLPKVVDRFLQYVPYAALGALIIPGAITSVQGSYLAAILGLTFAGVYSYLKGGVIVSIVGAITIAYITLLI